MAEPNHVGAEKRFIVVRAANEVMGPGNGKELSTKITLAISESGEIVHRISPPDGSYFWLVTTGAGRIFAQSNRHLYAFAPWGHTEPMEN